MEPMKKRFSTPIFAVILLLAACGLKPAVQTKPELQPENRLFSQGEALINQQLFSKALDLFSSYLDQYPDRHRAPDALMRMGEIYLLTARPAQADR